MWIIRNCKDEIVGNPKGYRTFRGANREVNRKGSPAFKAIWNAYDEMKQERPDFYPIISKITLKG